MINFQMNYIECNKTWSMTASRGIQAVGQSWLAAKPTSHQVRKFKQWAHQALPKEGTHQ